MDVSFLRTNPKLYGFDGEGAQFFQSLRELVENAVDACRGVSDRRAAKVTISVSKCAERGCLVLKVGDNGAGIVDPDESIQLGKSTKGEDEDGPNFGVGLSAVCVYAGELRLVTSRRGVPEALRRHYRVRDKTIVCEQSSVLPSPSDDSGTVVVVALPAGGGGDLTEKVAEYVRRFNLVPHFHTTIRFEARGCLSDMRIEVRPHGDAAWAAYLPPAAGDAEDVKSSKSGSAHAVAEEPSRIPCSVSVALFERDDDDDDDGDGDAAEREQQQPVKVRCVRLANGLPLADDLSSTSCGLFRAVRDVDWGNFGIAVLGGSEAAAADSEDERARPCQFVVRGPPHLAAVWVAVHVDATGKFASFTKNQLPSDYQGSKRSISREVEKCLASLRSDHPTIFPTRLECRSETIREESLPKLEEAISEIACASITPGFTRKMVDLVAADSHRMDRFRHAIKGNLVHAFLHPATFEDEIEDDAGIVVV